MGSGLVPARAPSAAGGVLGFTRGSLPGVGVAGQRCWPEVGSAVCVTDWLQLLTRWKQFVFFC